MSKATNRLAQVIVRAILPSPYMRMILRRSALVRSGIRTIWGGVKEVPYPHSKYKLYLDGYRNIGYLARNLENCEYEEKRITRWLFSRIPVSCVWDIGANIGTWSMFFTTVQPEMHVCCFEPDPENVKYLEMNKRNNKIDTWTIYPVALSKSVGEMIFNYDPTTGTSGSLEKKNKQWTEQYFHARTEKGTVAVSTLDASLASGAPEPQFIKCDVEGHEYDVFLGGLALLEKHHPVVLWEDSGKHETSELFKSLGYRFFDVYGHEQESPKWNTLAIHDSMSNLLQAIGSYSSTMPGT